MVQNLRRVKLYEKFGIFKTHKEYSFEDLSLKFSLSIEHFVEDSYIICLNLLFTGMIQSKKLDELHSLREMTTCVNGVKIFAIVTIRQCWSKVNIFHFINSFIIFGNMTKIFFS